MKNKEFIGTCIENPFGSIELLIKIVDEAQKISKRTFLTHCMVHPDTLADMKEFPHDYEYHKSGKVYFYGWSAIEHFYV